MNISGGYTIRGWRSRSLGYLEVFEAMKSEKEEEIDS